ALSTGWNLLGRIAVGGETGVSRACTERGRRVRPGGDERLSTTPSAAMNRTDMWRRIEAHPKAWDMVVVGGGATGVGVAIDAAARGYDVLLVEQSDFG